MNENYVTRNSRIQEILLENNEPPYRLNQIYDALFKQGVMNFDEITSLPKNTRSLLTEKLGGILVIKVDKVIEGENSKRVLFSSDDGNKFESVLMRYHDHSTLCVSSQSGCALGCTFCATGDMGFKKNLNVDELCDQILYFIQQKERPDNIVFMGMGEPLANPDFISVLEILMDKKTFGYGQRKLSISTVGILPELTELIKKFPEINISYSLHTPFEEQRRTLMPVSKAYSINEVFNVLIDHVNHSHRKVFLAYILIKNTNDSYDHAKKLAELVKSVGQRAYLFHVNIIKYHSIDTKKYSSPNVEETKTFSHWLTKMGVKNTIRMNFAEEINGACGQLAGE